MSDNLASWTAEGRAMPLFGKLVARARKRKHGQLTEREYILLERAVVATRPYVAGLMLGWYTAHRLSLRRALELEGVTVRHPKPPKLHRFQLKQSGLARLTELQQKISRKKGRTASICLTLAGRRFALNAEPNRSRKRTEPTTGP